MSFSAATAATLVRAKSVLLCVLVLLLLVTPVCGALCNATACAVPKTAEKSPCHESAGAPTGEQAENFRAERSCGLQELPVALAADFRSSRPDSLASTNAEPAELRASCIEPMQPRYFSDSWDWHRSSGLIDISLSPVTPLRI